MDSNRLLSQEMGQPSATRALPDTPSQIAAITNTAAHAVNPIADVIKPVRILIVEDDVPLARLLCSWLTAEGFAGELAFDGEEALRKLESETYQLMLLDLNMPKMDGLTLLTKMHADRPDLPVMVLTGRNRTEDRVITLNQGADDCLVKPFSLLELLARIRALLRRQAGTVPHIAAKAQPGLLLHRDEYRVERDGRCIDLTPREFALLEFLMVNSPKAVSRATLMEQVWRTPFDPSTNVVDVYMKYLRDKIDCEGEPKLIRTVRGVGYALACA